MKATSFNQQTRQRLRKQRRDLTSVQQRHHGEQVKRHLKKLSCFQKAKVVAVYRDADGELSTDAIIKACRQMNKQLLLPVLHPFMHGHLMFRQWPVNARMKLNRYGIDEPASCYDVIDARAIDLVIVPLVAFDENCYRMGMGGGYYDRTFSFRHINSWRKPKLIGVAHELQRVDKINIESWDIAMDAVITESKIYQR